MRRILASLIFLSLLSSATSAQESLGYLLRVEGHSFEAAVLERLVTLEASPQWSAALRSPKHKQLRASFADLLSAFAEVGNPPEELALERMPTGRMMGVLDDWRGKLTLRIRLDFKPDATAVLETKEGMQRTAEVLQKMAAGHGPMRMSLEFDPQAKTVAQSALIDHGADIALVVPGKRDWSRDAMEQIFRLSLSKP